MITKPLTSKDNILLAVPYDPISMQLELKMQTIGHMDFKIRVNMTKHCFSPRGGDDAAPKPRRQGAVVEFTV